MELNQTLMMESLKKIAADENLKESVFTYFSVNLFPEIVGLAILWIAMFFVGLFTKNLDEPNFWILFTIVTIFFIVARIATVVMGLM